MSTEDFVKLMMWTQEKHQIPERFVWKLQQYCHLKDVLVKYKKDCKNVPNYEYK